MNEYIPCSGNDLQILACYEKDSVFFRTLPKRRMPLHAHAEIARDLIILISLVTATAVSFVGTIGFLGLVAPHLARGLVGEDHRYLLPAAAFLMRKSPPIIVVGVAASCA